ncbi:hypothetical protein FB451DRAFT_1174820 [Mycena latifolia]|nr:hypothetical protein FB451DRAFT_1174820 [Mycena latifolia]
MLVRYVKYPLSTPRNNPEVTAFDKMNLLHCPSPKVRRSSRRPTTVAVKFDLISRAGFGGCLAVVGRFIFDLYPRVEYVTTPWSFCVEVVCLGNPDVRLDVFWRELGAISEPSSPAAPGTFQMALGTDLRHSRGYLSVNFGTYADFDGNWVWESESEDQKFVGSMVQKI